MAHLTVNLQSLDDKGKFSASARENPEIVIDYFPPVGTGEGYTSLELLMASFGSCLATTALTILRHRMRKTVDSLSIKVEGTQREEHPKSLEHMHVTLSLTAKDLTEAEVRQAITVAEEAICPVWAMIKGNVDVEVDVELA